jgi:O-antigen ligase/Flp pilus assembly protein TadD
MTRRISTLARLSLGAALALPAVAFAPRAAHAFTVAEAAMILPLAWLALGLVWRERGAPRTSAWAGAGACVLLLAYALVVVGAAHPSLWPWLKLQDDAWSLVRWRASLGLAALVLAAWAWVRRRHGELGPVAGLGLALGAWACLAGAFGPRPDISWNSVLEQSSYLVIFAAVWAQVRAHADLARRLTWLALGVGLLNTAYGLLQAAGLDPLPWNQSFGGRAGGFFGNPDLLGGHLALLLPLAWSLALDDRGTRFERGARWAVALALSVGLAATQTRGAWLGAAAGLTLVFAWAWRRRRALVVRRRRTLGLGLGLAVLGLGAWTLAHPQVWERLGDALQGRDVEVGRRLFLMHKSAQLAQQHPLLGQGPGAFRVSFASVEVKGLDPQDYASQPFVLSEHGHDDTLQWAADAGWPAALMWVALLACVILALWRRLPLGEDEPLGSDPWLVLGVLGAFVALQVHGLFNYPYLMLPTQGLAWGLVALALAVGRGPVMPPDAAAPVSRWPIWAAMAMALGLFLGSGQRLVEDHLWWIGEGELGLHKPDAASNLLVRTLSLDRREDRLWLLHGRSESERGYVWNSIGSLREAVRLSPYDAEAGVRLGRACVENRLFPEAETVLFKVADYAPNFVDVWEPLAAAYYNQGKFKESVQAYDWMLYFHVNDESAYANKAAALGSMGQLPMALVTLSNAQLALPKSGKIKVNLAITYLKMGMRKEARAAWKEAAALSPSDPQVDQLRGALH